MERIHTDGTDKALLKGLSVQEGDTLTLLYQSYFPMVCRMVIQNHGNEDDAKDLFQEGVIVLYEKSKDPDFRLVCKLKTYLYAVCRRLWLKQLQQKKKQFLFAENDEEDIAADVDESMQMHEEKEEQFKLMDSSLEKLGEPCKSLLQSFYLHQLSMQEIAEKFGYTNPDNAKTQKYKCLSRLKKIFFDQYKYTETL